MKILLLPFPLPLTTETKETFTYNFAIEVSPLFQTTPVSTKKITVEGMGVFFQFPIKGERKREKKGKGERNVQFSIN